MNAPTNLRVSSLHAGTLAVIQWDPAAGAAEYSLERKTSEDIFFISLYEGPDTSFTDTIPEQIDTVNYRVCAMLTRDRAWNDIDAETGSWIDYDSLDWQWNLDQSAYIETGDLIVERNRPPVISGEDGHLGSKYKGFSIEFNVTDPNPGNTVVVLISLDGKPLQHYPEIQQGVPYQITITDDQIFAWEDDSTHTIEIAAADELGGYSARVYTFTAVEDLVTTAVYYVLRDGVPVAKTTGITEWIDYMAVGTHRYQIRGVDRYDNYSDSNEVEITIAVSSCTLAIAASPSDLLELPVRRQSKPQRDVALSVIFAEEYFENRTYAIARRTPRREMTETVVLSTRTKQEFDLLFSIIKAGELVIYRDLYDMRLVGTIAQLPAQFAYRRMGGQPISYVADFEITIIQRDYDEVTPYD